MNGICGTWFFASGWAKRSLLASSSSRLVMYSIVSGRRHGRDRRDGHRALGLGQPGSPVPVGSAVGGRGGAQLTREVCPQGGRAAESAAYGDVIDVQVSCLEE